jgi:oxygen-dependent protoporphyrinogen oxidase
VEVVLEADSSVIVIGAGITGLATAFEFAVRQVPFILLEASDRAGGLILTEQVDGFTIEAGPDSLLVQKRAGLELCEELGLGPRLISTTPPRVAYVLHRGRLHALPSPSILGIPTAWPGIVGYDLLPWQARARLALEPFIGRPSTPVDESVASFFRRRFGGATVPLVAEPLLGGIHAGDVEKLSIKSLFPRLVDAEARRGSVIRAFRDTPPGGEGLFRSLSSGMGEMVRAIERRLPDGSLRFLMAATALRPHDGGWSVECGREILRSRAIVLAVPAHAAARLLLRVDREAAALCTAVPYVSTASVALAWRRADVRHDLRGSGFVVARGEGAPRITACTWVSSKWDGRAPAGHALFRAFIGGARDPEAVSLSDETLVEIAVREITQVLGISGPPRLARVYRWHDAGAQHEVGHLARMEKLEERLSSLPGLFVAGSGFRAIGIPDCVADGRAVAAAAVRQVQEPIRVE